MQNLHLQATIRPMEPQNRWLAFCGQRPTCLSLRSKKLLVARAPFLDVCTQSMHGHSFTVLGCTIIFLWNVPWPATRGRLEGSILERLRCMVKQFLDIWKPVWKVCHNGPKVSGLARLCPTIATLLAHQLEFSQHAAFEDFLILFNWNCLVKSLHHHGSMVMQTWDIVWSIQKGHHFHQGLQLALHSIWVTEMRWQYVTMQGHIHMRMWMPRLYQLRWGTPWYPQQMSLVSNNRSTCKVMKHQQQLVLCLNKARLQHHLMHRDLANAMQNMRTEVGIQSVFTLKPLTLRCLMEMLCHRHRSLKLDVIWGLMIHHLKTWCLPTRLPSMAMVPAVSICWDNCDRSSIWTLNPMLFYRNRILMSCCNMSWILMKIHMNLFRSSATAWKNSAFHMVHESHSLNLMNFNDWTALQTKLRLNVCLVFMSYLKTPYLLTRSALAHVLCALGEKRRTMLATRSGWEEADLWQGNILGCSPTEKPCSHRLPPTLQQESCPFVFLLWGNIKELWCLQLMWRMPSWQLRKSSPHVSGALTQVEPQFPTVLAEFCQVNVMVASYGTKIWWSFSKVAAWRWLRMKPTRQCCAQPKVIVWCWCTSMTFSSWDAERRY